MCHADERPAGHLHCGEEAFSWRIDHASLQRILGRERDGVDQEIEAAPFGGNPLEDRFGLAGRDDIERHEDRRLEFLGERLDEFLGLFVEVGHRELGPERPKSPRAAPGDGLLVGDADDEAALSFQQLRFHDRDHRAFLSLSLEGAPETSASVCFAIISSSSVGIT